MPLVAAAAVLGGTSLIAANQTKKAGQGALAAQQANLDALHYKPIDIEGLTQRAHENAVTNATQSLALERALTPALAETRTNLQSSVNDQLKLGGKLPADVANQVTQAARVGSGASGTLGGSSIPLTAQMLGVSALNLLNQRQQNASNLLAANPLPEAGLDPGAIASLEAQQNAQENQFALGKAGVGSNLANAQGQLAMANAGANNQLIGSLAGLLTANPSSYALNSNSLLGKGLAGLGSFFQSSQNPATNPISSFQGVGGVNSFGGGTMIA